MSLLAGALIGSAAAGVLGSALNTVSAARSNSVMADQYNRSLEFSKYQYENQKEYNSAVGQVSRLKQAGLNPSLAFGDGSAGSIGSVAAPSASSQHPVDYGSVINAASALGSSISQASLNDSQENLNSSNSFKSKAEGLNAMLRNYTQYDKDTADIYRMRKEGDLSKAKADSELAFRSTALESMKSEIRAQNMQANLFEQQTQTELERTAFEAAQAKVMEFRLSKEPERFTAELQNIVSQTAENYAQAYLAKVNAKSIDELTPWQKQSLAAGIQKAVSETTLNTKNKDYLEKQLGAFDMDKNFERVGQIVEGLTQGVMMGLGIGYFAKGVKGVKAIKGFGK